MEFQDRPTGREGRYGARCRQASRCRSEAKTTSNEDRSAHGLNAARDTCQLRTCTRLKRCPSFAVRLCCMQPRYPWRSRQVPCLPCRVYVAARSTASWFEPRPGRSRWALGGQQHKHSRGIALARRSAPPTAQHYAHEPIVTLDGDLESGLGEYLDG